MRKLIVIYRAGNGRRMKETYPITAEAAADPHERAAAIFRVTMGDHRRIVNWRIE